MSSKRERGNLQHPATGSTEGDPAAFTALYRDQMDRVYRYCFFRTGSEQDAQDLTSQVFMAAWEKLAAYRSEGSINAWLIGIARHKTADYFRRLQSTMPLEPVPLEAVAELLDNGVEFTQEVDLRLSIEQVLQQARALAPDRAEVFSLRMLAGLSNAEIAELTGKSEAAVRMLVHRALADLRQRLTPLIMPDAHETAREKGA